MFKRHHQPARQLEAAAASRNAVCCTPPSALGAALLWCPRTMELAQHVAPRRVAAHNVLATAALSHATTKFCCLLPNHLRAC